MGTDAAGGRTADDRWARLREIEIDLAALRAELGPPTGEPQDFGDAGGDLAAREERAALVAALETERDRLLDELGRPDEDDDDET
ncbi:hypothetical protein SAMN04489712_105367 [Thermomonospora echinospora]|uniref:Uncharacterized protein n=1 Tax=Thermomonospora echinospora TaxID=1992 RepID=A0A1H6ADE8_9ACTN|nr:hypothetical protein [Thermomonospora echinospora]SEG46501.1 hypothetical protein SAMN04489712_105367 [Thermomonospora echinospora]